MLKKSLVALAIASVAGAASAANITTTAEKTVSLEGNALHTVIAGHDVVVKLGAEYTVGDIVTFTFSGVEMDKAKVPPSIIVDAKKADVVVDGVVSETPSTDLNYYGLTLGLLNATETTATYRVTELSETGDVNTGKPFTTIGQSITLNGLELDATSFQSLATVTYSAKTSNDQILDGGVKNTTKYLVGKDQFVAGVDAGEGAEGAFDAVIDVNAQRLQFVGGTVVDQLSLKLEDMNPTVDPAIDTTWVNFGTIEKATYTVKGNFAFLDTDADQDGIQVKEGAVIFNPEPAAEADLVITDSAITVTYANTVPNYKTPVLTLDLEGTEADLSDDPISTQDFTATVAVEYSANSKKSTIDVNSDFDAGEWTLNGAVVHVPFMPFRDGYSPIVNVSNTSTQDGDIEVLVYAENNAAWVEPVSYMLPVQAKAEAQTNITSALRSVGIEGDVAFDIIVNAPKKDIEVSALYYNNGDRAVMNTVKEL